MEKETSFLIKKENFLYYEKENNSNNNELNRYNSIFRNLCNNLNIFIDDSKSDLINNSLYCVYYDNNIDYISFMVKLEILEDSINIHHDLVEGYHFLYDIVVNYIECYLKYSNENNGVVNRCEKEKNENYNIQNENISKELIDAEWNILYHKLMNLSRNKMNNEPLETLQIIGKIANEYNLIPNDVIIRIMDLQIDEKFDILKLCTLSNYVKHRDALQSLLILNQILELCKKYIHKNEIFENKICELIHNICIHHHEYINTFKKMNWLNRSIIHIISNSKWNSTVLLAIQIDNILYRNNNDFYCYLFSLLILIFCIIYLIYYF